ncbi:MAG: hypothetical protein JO015_16290 [Verrucomicrobia bacterium]|nr:hypothetical protein [Verrucomicrobiota bacterium]
MSLNPFEQLEFFVPEPRAAFNEIVETLLRGEFGTEAVSPYDVQGRLRVSGAKAGSPLAITIYQPKYFLGRWCSFKRQQVREAFQRTLIQEGAGGPWRWALCVPAALAPEDRRWLEHWRKDQPTAIEVFAGAELLRWLQGPSGRTALERMRAWGVTVPRANSARVRGQLRVQSAASCPHPMGASLSHYLYVSLHHTSREPLAAFEVELGHSPTCCLDFRPDERDWREQPLQGGRGLPAARRWRACRPLLPGEERLLIVIPIGGQTPWPLDFSLKHAISDGPVVEAYLRLEPAALNATGRLDFVPGPGPPFYAAHARNLSAPAA